MVQQFVDQLDVEAAVLRIVAPDADGIRVLKYVRQYTTRTSPLRFPIFVLDIMMQFALPALLVQVQDAAGDHAPQSARLLQPGVCGMCNVAVCYYP